MSLSDVWFIVSCNVVGLCESAFIFIPMRARLCVLLVLFFKLMTSLVANFAGGILSYPCADRSASKYLSTAILMRRGGESGYDMWVQWVFLLLYCR